MLRVAFMIYSNTDPGGEAQVARDMAREFSKHGESALIYPGKSYDKKVINPSYTHYTYAVSKTNFSFNPTYFTPQMLDQFFGIFEDFQPDLIHFHDRTPVNLLAQFWCIKNNIPKVMTVHILLTHTDQIKKFGEINSEDNLLISLAMIPPKQYFSLVRQENDLLIALNEAAKRVIEKSDFDGEIRVIPNGKDLQKYNVKPTRLDTKEINLAFIGWISKRKNQEYLLDVMKSLPPNYHLHLYGKYLKEKYEEEFLKKIEDLGLSSIHIHGYVEHEKIPNVLGNTHLFVSASIKEVQSLVIIEALASRTPIIGLANETTDELINDSNGKLLPATATPKQFAKEVENFIKQSESEYIEKCNNARKSVRNHDWKNVMEKTISAYHSAIQINREKTQSSNNEDRNESVNNFLKLMPSGKLKDTLEKSAIQKKNTGRIGFKAALLAAIGILASSAVWLYARIVRPIKKNRKKKANDSKNN